MRNHFLFALLLFAADAVAQNPANIVAKSIRFRPAGKPSYSPYPGDSSGLWFDRNTGYVYRANFISSIPSLQDVCGVGASTTTNIVMSQFTSLKTSTIKFWDVTGPTHAGDLLTTDLTANRTWALPDSNGTIALAPTVGTYATRSGLSPANGAMYFQTDDGRDAPAGKYYYLAGSWNLEPLRPEAFTEQNNEFFNVGANSESRDNIYYWSGNGGSISLPGGNVPGIARYQSGTSTNGFSGIYGGALGNPGGGYSFSVGATYFKLRITDLPTLSDGTNTYVFRAGIGTGLSGADLSSGVWIEYNTGTSANWIMKSANFTSTTTTASSMAVSTGAHTLEFLVNAAGTSVEYWVDGTSLGSVTTNIPGSGNNINPVIQMVKLAGTASRYVDVDYFKSWQRLTTARN